MKIRSWKEQRDEICTMIREISLFHGGDDRDWLKEYAVELIRAHGEDFSKLMEACSGLYQECVYAQKKGLKIEK